MYVHGACVVKIPGVVATVIFLPSKIRFSHLCRKGKGKEDPFSHEICQVSIDKNLSKVRNCVPIFIED